MSEASSTGSNHVRMLTLRPAPGENSFSPQTPRAILPQDTSRFRHLSPDGRAIIKEDADYSLTISSTYEMVKEREDKTRMTDYFTVVFEGDLRSFHGNPFKVETPFGRPFAIGIGNALETSDASEADLAAENEPALQSDTAANNIGERIRALREKHGLTQDELAVRLGGVTRGAIGNWERGLGVKLENLLLISRQLKVSLEWLATGQVITTPPKDAREPPDGPAPTT